jgi:hypothetical protein
LVSISALWAGIKWNSSLYPISLYALVKILAAQDPLVIEVDIGIDKIFSAAVIAGSNRKIQKITLLIIPP